MTIAGASFLTDPPVGSHVVCPFSDEDWAMDVVAKYASEGLKRSEGVILVVTKEHCAMVEERLKELGHDLTTLKPGAYQCLDAARTLASFMTGGMPDQERFSKKMAPALAKAKQFGHVRAYGEMVSLLFNENPNAAVRLEEFWNELIKKENLSLLCTYDVRGRDDISKDLYDQHSHCIV